MTDAPSGHESADFDDDDVLVSALRAGEETALAHVLDRHGDELSRVAGDVLGDERLARHVVQATWLAVIEEIGELDSRPALRTWLFQVMFDQVRGRAEGEHGGPSTGGDPAGGPWAAVPPSRFRPADDPEFPHWWLQYPCPWPVLARDRLVGDEVGEHVMTALRQLPLLERSVVALRDAHGWAAEEVGAVLRITAADQRLLLHRGRSTIRGALEGRLGDRT